MRINVTGNAGSGKSTLSQRLASELHLPLVEMDRIIWQPGWQSTPSEVCREQARPVILEDIATSKGSAVVIQSAADLANFIETVPSLQNQAHF